MLSISKIIFIALLFSFALWLGIKLGKERCPRCKKRVYFKFLKKRRLTKSTDEISEKCPKCGFVKKRKVSNIDCLEDAYTLVHKEKN